MNLDLIKRFPGWILDMTQRPSYYMSIMSDDYDSFLSCRYLRYVLGVPIGGFYAFDSGVYLTDEATRSKRTPVFMDVSIIKNGICGFDNHYLLSNNCMIANPNALLSYADRCDYKQKYPGSVLLFLYALFGDKNILDVEKMSLMCIDSFYKGLFNKGGVYRDINLTWLDRLAMREVLKETIDTHDKRDYACFLSENGFDRRIIRSADDCCLYELSDSGSSMTLLTHNAEEYCFPHQVLSVVQDYCGYDDMVKGYLNGKKAQPHLGLFSAARTQSGRFAYSAITNNAEWRLIYEQKPAA